MLNNDKSVNNRVVSIGKVQFSSDMPLSFILGPCVVEGRDHTMYMAENLSKITEKMGVGFVFKSSFDKANRTSLNSHRGVGIDEGLKIFQEVKQNFNCPVITDVHLPEQCSKVAEVVDVLQIPAFLCRQTDILIAAAKTQKPVLLKKGQFLAPWDMLQVASKLSKSGNDNLLLCERGATFGYNNLVVDMRGLAIMASSGYPVIFDATHSVQIPGGQGDRSGGQREFVAGLSRAAVGMGVSGLFLEVHDNPDVAPCDGPNMIKLTELEDLLKQLILIDKIVKKY